MNALWGEYHDGTVTEDSVRKDDPFGTGDRGFMIDTVNAAQDKLAEAGQADIQAILWYPVKELWGALTAELETDQDGSHSSRPAR